MHRHGRTWNIPLGIGLFGAAVLVGGAILAIPETTRAPSHVDVSDPIASKPFPSFPEETHPTIPGAQLSDESATTPHAPLPAPTAIGGGPTRGSEGDRAGERDEPPSRAAPTPAPQTPPPATPTPAPTTATPEPTSTATPAETTEPPPAAATAADAGVAATDAAFSFNPEAGTITTPAGSVPYDPNMPYVFPTIPPATTAGTVVSSGGVTAPAGGSTSGTGGGVATTQQSITAPIMLPVSESPDRFWTGVSPYLRSGDAIVANATTESSPLLTFADRVRTDAPLVTYIVAFANAPALESAVAKGLPATLDVVGLSSSAGVTDAALSSAAAKVHENNRRMFLTLNVPTDGPSLAEVAKSADIVELIVAGANGTEVATNAKSVATSLGAKTQIYVRLPTAMTSPSAAPSAANAVVAALPNAGVSLPASVAASIDDYRKR